MRIKLNSILFRNTKFFRNLRILSSYFFLNVDYFPGTRFKRAKYKIAGYRKYWMLHFGLRDKKEEKKRRWNADGFFFSHLHFLHLICFGQPISSSFFFVILFPNPPSNNEANDFLVEKHNTKVWNYVPKYLLHDWNLKLNFHLSQCVSLHWTIVVFNIFFCIITPPYRLLIQTLLRFAGIYAVKRVIRDTVAFC